jgi:phage-related protein
MKDSLDVDSEIGAYNIKAKLTIPSGTAYSKQSTTTNITGFVQGIAAINPTITFKPQTETITITESVSGQVFHMAYAGDWQSKVIEIDCEDRRVYVKEDEDDTTGTDITKYVDFDVDWFSLHGEYAFTGTGCVIRTVNFVERW